MSQSSSSGSSRREFLKRASAGAAVMAFPTIVTNRALGSARLGLEPASERIRIGMIGVGNQGNGNLNKVIKNVVAVCEVDSERLQAAEKKVAKATGQTCAAYSDYRKLLDDQSIDAVVITTPDHWHALPTIHACMAGKDVYVEKPLSLTIAEGQAMVKAARKYNRIVQTGSQQRSDGKFRQACELVRNGKLGKIKKATVGLPKVNFDGPPVPDSAPPAELDYDFWLGAAPERPYNKLHVHYNFRFFWDYSGGQMTNFGAHHLDIVQWALGMDESGPHEIEGTADFHPKHWYEVPSRSTVTFKYPHDVVVVCEQGGDARGGVLFEGTEGSLYVTRGKIESDPKDILKAEFSGNDERLYVSEDHHKNWLECIKTRKAPICDVAIGHRSATVCHLANIAVRSAVNVHSGDGYRDVGQITWDPVKESIVASNNPKAGVPEMVARPYRSPWALPDLT